MTNSEATNNTVDRDQAVIKVEGVSRWFGNVVSDRTVQVKQLCSG
jgi:hypothetical protein